MTDVELLKKAIKESGLRRHFIANKMNVGYDRFCKASNGKIEFKASEVKALSQILGLSLEEMEAIFLA